MWAQLLVPQTNRKKETKNTEPTTYMPEKWNLETLGCIEILAYSVRRWQTCWLLPFFFFHNTSILVFISDHQGS